MGCGATPSDTNLPLTNTCLNTVALDSLRDIFRARGVFTDVGFPAGNEVVLNKSSKNLQSNLLGPNVTFKAISWDRSGYWDPGGGARFDNTDIPPQG